MPRDYAIEIVGATRTERGILDVERQLAEELREATRKTRTLLYEAAVEAAPTPDPHTGEEKGEGVGTRINFPQGRGGLRRFAGRAPGGAPLVSLTYQVELFVEEKTVAGIFETGSGKYGPHGSPFPIYPSEGRALLLKGGPQSASGVWFGNRGADRFDGGNAGEELPIFDHVMHPGMKARPFLEKSARDSSDAVDLLYDQAVHRAVHGF